MTYRVVQWTTGNVGRQSVAGIVEPPRPRAGRLLRLVGRQGRPGRRRAVRHRARSGSPPPTTSTRCSRCEPDCVVYNPMWVDVDEMVRILEAGVQHREHGGVHHRPLPRRRAASESSTRASGAAPRCSAPASAPASPTCIAIVSASVCDRVDKITVTEAADTTGYDSPATELPVGFGRPIDDPDLQR